MEDYRAFAERERSGWSDKDIVASYVEKFGPVTDFVAADLVERVAAEGTVVLDLCCGQGALTAMLVEADAEVTGLDFSEEMLALARIAAPGADLKRGDAAALPFDDDSLDAVVCNFGMMHLPDQPKALAEIRRILKPAARFVMATWAAPEMSPAFGTVFGAIKANADFSVAPPQPDLFTFARPEGANVMMSTEGLKMVSHEMVTPSWELSAPGELFDIFLTATVGAAMLIKGQRPEVISAIRDRVTTAVTDKFAHDKGYRVPVPVAVVSATPI